MAAPETPESFTAEERAAMKERAAELRAAARRGKGKVDGETDLQEKLAEMPEGDRAMGERIHALVKEHAPQLQPKTWYGQPAWAKDGKVVLFFQSSAKFNTRYSTLGFSEEAALDAGKMWATSYALLELTGDDERRIAELISRAASSQVGGR